MAGYIGKSQGVTQVDGYTRSEVDSLLSGIASDAITEGNSSVEVVDTGTGHVAITTDGSERVRVDSSGNVGIGTSSPATFSANSSNNLVVGTGSGSEGITVYSGASSEGALSFGDGTSGAQQYAGFINYSHSSDEMKFGAGASVQMRVTGGGNLQFNSGYGSAATAYGCRAWVNFNGTGTPAIRDSGNVSSITDNGTGLYTANFSTTFPDDDYAVGAMAGDTGGGGSSDNSIVTTDTQSTTSVRLRTRNVQSSGATNDASFISIAVFR